MSSVIGRVGGEVSRVYEEWSSGARGKAYRGVLRLLRLLVLGLVVLVGHCIELRVGDRVGCG